ncbi:MAG: hydrogenase iron-sulfur subunit [Nanobdellota archaeon]
MNIGVFLCEGDEEIKKVIDMERLKSVASQEEEVGYVSLQRETLCSVEGQQKMLEDIKANSIDHVVVAACTPKLYEDKFRKVLEGVGINPGNLVVANIREQCAYAHNNNPETAQKKAELYTKLAIEQVKLTKPLSLEKVKVTKSALVIGGGWSGLRAALGIAKKGFKVDLLEKTDQLGGSLINYTRLPPKDESTLGELKDIISEVVSNKNITIHKKATIKKSKGFPGEYNVTFVEGEEKKQLTVGAIVVAIGHSEYLAKEFDKKNNPDVVSLSEYNQMLFANGATNGNIIRPSTGETPKSIAFIQCNGSLDQRKNNYCSKYCCDMTASSVRQTWHRMPGIPITVYYKEIRAFNNVSEVYLKDTQAMKNVTYKQGIPESIDSDLIVLANAVEPADDTDAVRKVLVLDKDKNGFFREADYLMNRVSTYDPGMFVVGTCSGPKTITERIQDARVASDLVTDLLANEELTKELYVSKTNEDLCGGCGTCIRTCPFGAITNEQRKDTNRGVAVVDKALCRGCGNCVSACPQNARDLVLYPSLMLQKSVEVLSNYDLDGPKILVYACNGCAYPAIDQAVRVGYELPPNIFVVRTPCSGRVDTQFIEYALTHGFDGVMVGMCETNSCHYIVGNEDCCKRIDLLQPLLESKGISREKIYLAPICFSRGEDAINAVNDFLDKLNKLEEGKNE